MGIKIEFGLPNGAGGMAAAHSSGHLRNKLKAWASQYKRDLKYTTTRHDHRHWLQVEFAKQHDFTLFAITWNEDSFMGWERTWNDN